MADEKLRKDASTYLPNFSGGGRKETRDVFQSREEDETRNSWPEKHPCDRGGGGDPRWRPVVPRFPPLFPSLSLSLCLIPDTVNDPSRPFLARDTPMEYVRRNMRASVIYASGAHLDSAPCAIRICPRRCVRACVRDGIERKRERERERDTATPRSRISISIPSLYGPGGPSARALPLSLDPRH